MSVAIPGQREISANSNANPLMLLACNVNTAIHTHRFHLLALRVRVQCGLGLLVFSVGIIHIQNVETVREPIAFNVGT